MHAMQAAYKQELSSSYGITFNSLMCLNNMPIKRYVDYLQRQEQLEEYMQVGGRSAVAPLLSSKETQDCPSVHVLRVPPPQYLVLFLLLLHEQLYEQLRPYKIFSHPRHSGQHKQWKSSSSGSRKP